MKRIRVISFILTIGIMALIFFFSCQNSTDSAELSNGVTYRVAGFISMMMGEEFISISELTALMHNFTRKCAHFSEYALLAMPAYVTIRLSIKNKTAGRAVIHTILFCMLYAITDEIHQHFVSGRSARVFDVFVDTCGAAAGTAIISALILIIKFYGKRKWRLSNDS